MGLLTFTFAEELRAGFGFKPAEGLFPQSH